MLMKLQETRSVSLLSEDVLLLNIPVKSRPVCVMGKMVIAGQGRVTCHPDAFGSCVMQVEYTLLVPVYFICKDVRVPFRKSSTKSDSIRIGRP